MKLVAYRLQPSAGGGFHFGREGLDLESSSEIFPSDSLFAALVSAMVELRGEQETEQFLTRWPREGQTAIPPFRLSSLLPNVGNLPLFPMPRLRVNLNDSSHQTSTKALKKLAYVSPEILRRLLANQPMGKWLPEDNPSTSPGLLLHSGRVWIADSERSHLPNEWRTKSPAALQQMHIWSTERVPHVALDRQSDSSTIYHVGRTAFAPDCGLWLLAQIEQDEALLENLLEVLADRGIGGRRASGQGGFSVVTMQTPDLPTTPSPRRWLTFSRYNPTLAELEAGVLGQDASYELVDIGGWLWSPQGPAQRRRRVRLIEAGSILAAPAIGRLVDVRPTYASPRGDLPHPVYRSGVALTIGFADAGGN